ncbi:reticulon-4-interacting protein 1, mitochondrial-like [Euwallacea similis]|uniref:reticulon-4-interacting protein 1, mitochondrial-like n=1 Tax=Euwallacea similis TaxID=1736056 RepID=UPI00344EFA25
MDAFLFRGSQKLESLQFKVNLVGSKAKDLIQLYSQTTPALLHQVWHNQKFEHLRYNLIQLITYLIEISKDFKDRFLEVADPKRLWMFLTRILAIQWSKKDVFIACASFLVGGLVGAAVGLSLRQQKKTVQYMEAVQLKHYLGIESVLIVEDATAPYECGDNDVLINVKAGSVHIVDACICKGYGKTLRKVLRRLYKESPSDLPVILGRDCTGIITDLGKRVQRLEIGDEVWVTVPFWSQGTLCQTVLVHENRVARKPKNVGFEGACSIPYAGSLAFSALTEADVDIGNAQSKKFFIQDGCTPVGCVLIQLLNHWNAHITTTCYKRAVPVAKALGATEILYVDDEKAIGDATDENDKIIDPYKSLLKELQVRGDRFDFIVITRNHEGYDWSQLYQFCSKNGKVLTTVPEELLSDSCGFFSALLLTGYVRLKHLFGRVLDLPTDDYAEAHLCHATLEKLTELVEDGVLQTVVDKVFQPKDIEVALHYIQSEQSIGSSVVTFR